MRAEAKKNLARNKAKGEIRYGSEKEIKSYERGSSVEGKCKLTGILPRQGGKGTATSTKMSV